jgi:glutamate N-acetyltransferase/amino-acid N-acetyltransferase
MDKIRAAMPNLVKSLSPQGGRAAAEAIMTTDTKPEARCARSPVAPSRSAGSQGRRDAQPHLATMFCFVASDAAVARALAPVLAGVDRSFNRTTVDSIRSTATPWRSDQRARREHASGNGLAGHPSSPWASTR